MASTDRVAKLQAAYDETLNKMKQWFGEDGESAVIRFRAGLRALHHHDHHATDLTRIPADWVARPGAAFYVWRESAREERATEPRDRTRAILENANEESLQNLVTRYTINGEDYEAVLRAVRAWRFLDQPANWVRDEWERAEQRMEAALDQESDDEE